MSQSLPHDPNHLIDVLVGQLRELLRMALVPAGPVPALSADDAQDDAVSVDPGVHRPARTPFTFAEPAPQPVPERRVPRYDPDLPAEAFYAAALAQPIPLDVEAEADRIGLRAALGALDMLGANPRLRDVVSYLLRPLVKQDLVFDGNAEAILTRRANEFSDYRSSHLAAAARLLLDGRHTHFPEAQEIYAALGRVARPGRVDTQPQQRTAA